MVNRLALAIALLAACGSKSPTPATPGSGSGAGASAKPAKTPLEARRDAACEALQPRLTECAVEDAKRSLSPAEYKKLNPDELRGKHKQKFLGECEGSQMSSRQVRVLEVCYREETQCDPLAECLAHLAPEQTDAPTNAPAK